MLQPVQLRTFQQVLVLGSFAEAGEHLGFTASAVSQQMAALERATGLDLFERRARSVRPTAAAQAFARRVDVFLGQLDTLEREARAMAAGERGVVRIGSFPTASAGLLPGALARLVRSKADIEVLLDEDEPSELIPRLLAATLDVALVYEYEASPQSHPAALERVPLLRESLVLLVGRSRRPPRSGPVALADLADEIWVSSREETPGARTLERLCAGAGFRPRVAFRSNDYEVVRGLVGAGVGIALVPALAHRDDPLVVATPLREPDAGRRVLALRRKSDPNPALPMVLSTLTLATRARARGDRLIRPETSSLLKH